MYLQGLRKTMKKISHLINPVISIKTWTDYTLNKSQKRYNLDQLKVVLSQFQHV
jgi:hypothetical protein